MKEKGNILYMTHLHQRVDSFSLEILLKHDYEEERTVQKNKI